MSSHLSVSTREARIPSRSTPSSPLSTEPSFIERFRMTNIIYRYRAAAFRSSLQLTSHARKRAEKLELQVDTVKASNCPQKYVSSKPLPIIDPAPSPPPVQEFQWVHETAQTMPKSAGGYTSSDSEDEYEVKMDADTEAALDNILDITSQPAKPNPSPIVRSHNRPSLRCIIPTEASNATTGSKCSPDSEWTSISLTTAVSPSIGPKGKRVEEYPLLRSGPAQNTIRLPAPRARHMHTPLEVPLDVDESTLSWGYDEVEIHVSAATSDRSDMASSAASSNRYSSSASSSSGSEASASGPSTPADDQRHGATGFTIRIKRSNSSMDLDGPEVIDLTSGKGKGDAHVEKRPKFERKGYVRSGSQYSKNARPRSLNVPYARSDSALRSVSAPVAGRR